LKNNALLNRLFPFGFMMGFCHPKYVFRDKFNSLSPKEDILIMEF